MIKGILALITILGTVTTKAQIYLGRTEIEILAERKASEALTRDTIPDGTPVLIFGYVGTSHYTRRYFFDSKSKMCDLYVVEPVSEEALNTFIEYCNENYISVRKNSWETRVDHFKVDVALEYGPTSGIGYFYFTRKQ